MKLMLVDGARLGGRLKTSLPAPKRRPVGKCVVLLDDDPRWKALHGLILLLAGTFATDNLLIKTKSSPGSRICGTCSHGAKATVEREQLLAEGGDRGGGRGEIGLGLGWSRWRCRC